MTLTTKNEWFIDKNGRTVLLRGLNLGGSSKVPTRPNGATHIKTDFKDQRDVSFVGRPFPLREADEHFRRIKHWGFNSLRFLITWEAIEHRQDDPDQEPYRSGTQGQNHESGRGKTGKLQENAELLWSG